MTKVKVNALFLYFIKQDKQLDNNSIFARILLPSHDKKRSEEYGESDDSDEESESKE
jgi:hypothetical protein